LSHRARERPRSTLRQRRCARLTQHYAVVHRRSTVYYPQGNGLAESTNKTLEMILRKIVEANRTDWDRKLHSALWAYRTSYKTSIRSTPLCMAFGLEAMMPLEFIVPSLRIQLEHNLNESESEHARVEQLLRLEEERIQSMEALEPDQWLRKAFVDRHRKRNEVRFGKGKVVLLFQSQSGLMLGKLRLRWTGPYWIVNEESTTYQFGTLSGEILSQWANGFRLKPYYGKLPPNPFLPTKVRARLRRKSRPRTGTEAVIPLRRGADEVVLG
jgi:hypothetical protein